MRTLRLLPLLLAFAVAGGGCYHATVVTGKTPGPVVIDKPFALGFIYGLIPPPTVETMDRCPDGVAIVETQHSIVNSLVNILTGGIVTPMHITVTCAAPGSAAADIPADADLVVVDADASTEEAQTAVGYAADQAADHGAPVYVRFE